MELCGQLNAQAALPLRKEPQVPTGQEVDWAPVCCQYHQAKEPSMADNIFNKHSIPSSRQQQIIHPHSHPHLTDQLTNSMEQSLKSQQSL